jgi:hypothetical protein
VPESCLAPRPWLLEKSTDSYRVSTTFFDAVWPWVASLVRCMPAPASAPEVLFAGGMQCHQCGAVMTHHFQALLAPQEVARVVLYGLPASIPHFSAWR